MTDITIAAGTVVRNIIITIIQTMCVISDIKFTEVLLFIAILYYPPMYIILQYMCSHVSTLYDYHTRQ